MKQNEMFGTARWIGAKNVEEHDFAFSILRRTFVCDRVKKATLSVVGLGFFHCYINGRDLTENTFLPLSSDYEVRENYPVGEVLSGHRIYVPQFDVTDLITEGKNLLVIHYGGGWYSCPTSDSQYGKSKVIYRLTVETENGVEEFVSSESDKLYSSFVNYYYLTSDEHHDYTAFDDRVFDIDYDDSNWEQAQLARPLDTEYLTTDCPADALKKVIKPVVTHKCENTVTYDCGMNLTGVPVIKVKAPKGEKIEIHFSEEMNPDGTLNKDFFYWQHFIVISDGKERLVRPLFTWFGFRYFSVEGNAEVEEVRFIHTDVKVTSAFDSDNVTLNYLYNTYLNTQLCNMHTGIPSDCPHIERRGYTGDGQLVCHAVMNIMDAKAFYRKWIDDISDCQDIYSGHVQYTAPYIRSGGGPGGWGIAIVEVPYMYYLHYGDKAPMTNMYGQMMRFLDFLEAHSRNELVISDIPTAWALGDWCPPMQVVLPAPFVNNYFYIKAMKRMIEIAGVIGRSCDIPMFEKRIEIKKQAMMDAYFNKWDSNFIGGLQGANAFAVDVGIGNEHTYRQLVNYYRKLGRFDTGIFGTDVVTRVLFEHGDGELAIDLLASSDPISFEGLRQAGATTLWEYWPHSTMDRSHNHPMFGAVVAYLFDYILGIRQEAGNCAYDNIVIAPVLSDKLNRVSGKRAIPKGEVAVAYEKQDGKVTFTVSVPTDVHACFRFGDTETELAQGTTTLSFDI